jgi:hypothetical protein
MTIGLSGPKLAAVWVYGVEDPVPWEQGRRAARLFQGLDEPDAILRVSDWDSRAAYQGRLRAGEDTLELDLFPRIARPRAARLVWLAHSILCALDSSTDEVPADPGRYAELLLDSARVARHQGEAASLDSHRGAP